MYEELVKRLRSQCQGYGKECEDCNADGNCRSQMENEAADAIVVLSKKENTTQWIPVTERLPEKYVNVLCHLRSLDRKSEYYSIDHLMEDGQWWKAANSWKHEVTHWMPLPEPPKEEENDRKIFGQMV